MKVGVQNSADGEANAPLLPNFDVMGRSDQDLVSCPNQRAKIHLQVLDSLLKLTDKATLAGFDLRVASGFRSFDRQLMIWNNKANGLRLVLDEVGQPIDISQLSDDEKVFAILRWSALPGASRHHWGTDIDVYDASRVAEDYPLQLTLEETEGDGPFAEFHDWLTQELAQNPNEFYRPYIAGAGSISPEPWHLSYAPLARIFATQLTETLLRDELQATDIALKDSVLKNLHTIYQNYIKPYQ
ncbi:peptidase M15 [Cellvibrio zantedeschiae]|uniref:Peptidase M15 n=1 Tax=Cellvibrio zantedeschiae TaxID=1237077 RepID=A0ABQ3B6A2_9GAMM|nr:M15 family metallopeptidase [Cellvibrio zantedeschiae]GGY80144.1 peptidase M15 [Cellvibrio zantedeschiae]